MINYLKNITFQLGYNENSNKIILNIMFLLLGPIYQKFVYNILYI